MMQFTDRTGDLWSLNIDYETVCRVKEELQINLLSVVEENAQLLDRLANDEMLLVDVISVCLTPQIEAKKLTATDFAHRLDGNTLDKAISALIEGIANFSRPRKGAIILKTWETIKAAEDLTETKIATYLDQIDFGKLIDETLPPTK